MYSLDINFLNDRPEYRPEAAGSATRPSISLSGSAPMFLGIAVGIALPLLAGAYWFYLQNRNSELVTKQQELTTKLGDLDARSKEADALNAEAAALQAEADAFANVFNRIKPLSALLQDLSDRVPPGVQVDTLTVSGDTISLAGTARTYDDANDFVLVLQKSPFLVAAETLLLGAQQVSYPGAVEYVGFPRDDKGSQVVTVKLPQVVSYRISTKINTQTPASQLLRELERKGSEGLVTRIRTLQEKGVLTK